MKYKSAFCFSLCVLAAFSLWTAAVQFVDVQPIGPLGSSVGFATMNQHVYNLTGVHMGLYRLTDWLSLVPLAFIMGFALLGLTQWIQRKHLAKVDYSILMLGVFYCIVMAVYVFFEMFVVNYRPVLIEGTLEASYPSSTTMLVLCVMPTAIMQCNIQIKNTTVKKCIVSVITAFTVFMVLARLVSGVHWFSDIIGGAFLSAGLVGMYYAAIGTANNG